MTCVGSHVWIEKIVNTMDTQWTLNGHLMDTTMDTQWTLVKTTCLMHAQLKEINIHDYSFLINYRSLVIPSVHWSVCPLCLQLFQSTHVNRRKSLPKVCSQLTHVRSKLFCRPSFSLPPKCHPWGCLLPSGPQSDPWIRGSGEHTKEALCKEFMQRVL